MSETPPPAAGKPCPTCGKPAAPRFLPFCSARCKQVDLGRWFSGTYRVETAETPDGPDAAEDGE